MRIAERNSKGNLRKPSRQDVLNFVAAAWDAVPEATIIQSLKGCGISNALDGLQENLLHGWLSSVGDIRPEHPEELQAECYSLLFDTNSDGSFDGFESEQTIIKNFPIELLFTLYITVRSFYHCLEKKRPPSRTLQHFRASAPSPLPRVIITTSGKGAGGGGGLVWNFTVIEKLRYIGIAPELLAWIAAYLGNRTQYATINTTNSDLFEVYLTVLGPL